MSTQEYDDSDLESERDAIVLQASTDEELAGEVITPGGEVTLAGRSFRVAEKVGLMPLLKFSHASSLKTTDERAYVALYQILKDIIRAADPPCGRCNGCKTAGRDPRSRDCTHADQGDWEEFEEWAVESKADADELLDVVTEAIKVISARPTESRSVSSGGSREVSRRSTASRSGRQAGGSGSSRQGRRAT